MDIGLGGDVVRSMLGVERRLLVPNLVRPFGVWRDGGYLRLGSSA